MAACAAIEAIQEEKLVENAAERGEQLMAGLKKLQSQYPVIGDVRGKGLMVATEFTTPNGEPDAQRAGKVLKACLDNRLLLLLCGTYKNVVRWIPPLVVDEEQIREALVVFEKSLRK